jgi:pantoate--beta-alanine ligase
MKVIASIAELRRVLEPHRAASTIALVPTMGALHAGHVALFAAARARCDVVVGSVFVNPAQFGDPADLAAYPRDVDADGRIASAAGVDVLFAPAAEDIYPAGFSTWVDVEGPARGLEGAFRPGHFRGVATVVLKLFNIVSPHVAFFGQKDAQQVAVIRQMVRDLDVNIELAIVPTVRDEDGVALSSRNARLSPDERLRARAIPRAIDAGVAAYRSGGDPAAAARAALAGLDVDYVSVADFAGTPTLAIAVRIGTTRLIDNVPLIGVGPVSDPK